MGHALEMCAPASGRYRTVCYRCQYKALEATGNKCPNCGFPLIYKAGRQQTVGRSVEQIFDRVSVRVGAPPLPGVDGRPRKAQMLAEARRRRRSEHFAAARALEHERAQTTRRYRAAKVTVAFVSAFVAGLVAAVLVNSGL
jgi:hypothetical protein